MATQGELREYLWGLPFDDLAAAWTKIEDGWDDGVRQLCLADRYYLLVRVCRRVDAVNRWLYERCREVERNPDDHLDLWAREHYKSSIITFAGGIQEILRDPEITIGIFAHTRPIATKFASQIKAELEGNVVLKAAFPDVLYADPRKDAPKWSNDAFTVMRRGNPKECTVEAWGLVDGQPTAAHYALRIYDDVVTRESVSTPEQIEKTTAAWELSDNLGTTPGRKWHAGTRYSFADTYESILKRGVLFPRVRPATDDGTPDGRPVFWSVDEWERKKITQGPQTIACQQLQNPLAGSQAMFDAGDLMYYEIRPRTLNVYIMVDPARSMKRGSANTAMVVIGVDAGRNRYLLDGYDHRMDLKDRWENLWNLYRKWLHEPGVQSVRVGYEAYGAQADLDYFNERQSISGQGMAIEELKWPRDGEGSKDDRVQRLGPDIRAHRFYLPYLGRETELQRITAIDEPSRVAKPIKRRDSDGNMYELSERFKMQVAFYPFCALKDCIDAAARLYDLEPVPPKIYEAGSLEPEAFIDS